MKSSATRRGRPFLLILIVLCLASAVVGLAELLLWAFGVESASSAETEPSTTAGVGDTMALVDDIDLGWALKRGFDGDVFGTRYKINSSGFRGDNIKLKKPERTLRVLCLGDSSTYGLMVPGHEIYPAVLERLLARKHQRERIEVINTGVAAYTSLQTLLVLTRRGFQLEPDLVTICVGINDNYPIPPFEGTDAQKYNLWRRTALRIRTRLAEMRTYSALERLVTRFAKDDRPMCVELNAAGPGPTPPKAPTQSPASAAAREEPAGVVKTRATIEEYEDNLTRIVEECRSRNVPLLMFSFSLPDAHASVMREVAGKFGVEFLDLEPAFAQKSRQLRQPKLVGPGEDNSSSGSSGPSLNRNLFVGVYENLLSPSMIAAHSDPALFLDPCHPSAMGHRLIAENLADAIVNRGLLKSER